MSPIHHHFELSGWKENTVIVRFLDHVHPLRPARSGNAEAAMIYSGKKAVVLGLGHSGEAAALLLREEGADVTVCEAATTPCCARKPPSSGRGGLRLFWATTQSAISDL